MSATPSSPQPSALATSYWRPELVESIQASGLDGHFGEFGGAYVPEVLVPAVQELAAAYLSVRSDPEFWKELDELESKLGPG